MTTHTRVDTVVVYQPQLASTKHKAIVDFSLPRILFAERVDTLNRAIIVADSTSDKATVRVPIVTREYQDSTYRAVVSGPAIGDYGPTLDSVYIYNKYTTSIVEAKRPFVRPYATAGVALDGKAFTAGGGVLLKDRYGLGMDLLVADGRTSALVRASFVF